MIEFLLNMALLEQILLGLLLLVFLYQLYFYLRYLAVSVSKIKSSNSTAPNFPVSVIICAHNEGDNLQNFLPSILQQDYPEYEVIVVNDESEDNTAEVLARFAQAYPHLHVSFVPKGAQLRSTKKLALTLGIKAAQYEHLLFTDADCRPASPHWIREMVRGFESDRTEIVLGYSPYFVEKRCVNRFIQYDTLFNGLQYMGFALAHQPYMGVGRNLMYKRSTFFEHKGFAGLLGSRAGDDDLFINKIATKKNTAVVCTPESLTWSVPKTSYSAWLLQKERHLSVSPNYRFDTKLHLFFEPFTRALLYGTIIAVGCLSSNWIVWCIAAGLLLLRFITQCTILNVAAAKLHGKHFGLSILFFEIFLPLNNIYLFIRHAVRKRRLKADIW